MKQISNRLALSGLMLALVCGGLAGCAAAVVGGAAAAGGGMVATDRRSPQTQGDDQTIELRAASRVSDAISKRGNVSVVSFYRKVLLTGEVPTADDRQRAEAAAASVPEVMGVVNELAVMPDSTFGQRANDTLTTSKVKTNLLNANGVPGNSIKVVTERGTVYLMGRLTRRESDLATEVARTTPGVQRVVRVVDFISEQAALHPTDPTGTSAAPVPVSSVGATTPGSTAVAPATSAAGGVAAGDGVVTHPVTQPTIVQPAQQPIQVQTLPPVK